MPRRNYNRKRGRRHAAQPARLDYLKMHAAIHAERNPRTTDQADNARHPKENNR